MNTNQLRRLASKGKLPPPIILQDHSFYRLAYEIGGDLVTLYAINSREPRQFARLDAALAAASLITPLDQVTFRTTDAVPTHDDIVTETQSASARRQLKVAQSYTPTEAPTQQTPLANLQERAKLAIALSDDKLMRQCFDELATLEAAQ